jgi:hypothetical protein
MKLDPKGWRICGAALAVAAAVYFPMLAHLRDQTSLTADESDYLFPRVDHRFEHIEFLRRQADPQSAPAQEYEIAVTRVKRHPGGLIGRVEVIVYLDDTHTQRHINYFGMTGSSASGWMLAWDLPAWRYFLNRP